MLLLVMSLVDGIGQVKGIELMVKCELPRRYIAVDSIGGPERGPSCTLIGVLSSHRRQYGLTLSSLIVPQTRRLPVTTLIHVTFTNFTPLTTWQTQRHSLRHSKFSAYRRNTIALALSISP